MIRKVKYGINELRNSTDLELFELVFDKASELYFETFGENLNIADKAMADFFAIQTLDSEVKNGGFDQFFHNNGLENGYIALNGFTRIGAESFKSLTEKAIEIFKNQDSEYRTKRNPDFENLDEEFYNLKSWEKLQIDYIRQNYEKFIVE